MQKAAALLESFIDTTHSDFSIHNLPYGVFFTETNKTPRIGSAIGSYVIDLSVLEAEGLLGEYALSFFNRDALNTFAAQEKKVTLEIRKRIQALLSKDNKILQNNSALQERVFISQNEVTMLLPFKIGGFSDFYASEYHATNVGKLFRPNDAPLLPNWKYLPIGYNGRASTVFVSETPVYRPNGQIKLPDAERPIFTACKKLDFELEMGIFVGVGNPDRKPISGSNAHAHIFGLTLLNDWSARDIQAFEYQPLGPFLSKSFATSISPWVVPLEAILPFMEPMDEENPEPVDYLKIKNRMQPNIKLKVELQPRGSSKKTIIAETNYNTLYWTMEQMLAHHTVNGCVMAAGDLLGTGTISGPTDKSLGSLLEMTLNGKKPLKLQDGVERTFLEDGDKVIFTGYCENENYKVGFGSVAGVIC